MTIAARADLPEVARHLADAFSNDPVLLWIARQGPGRDAARERFFLTILRLVAFPDGLIEMATLGPAAAVWTPSEKLEAQPLPRELRALPMLVGLVGLSRMPRLIALRKLLDRWHPKDQPHDYLNFLGVASSAQGQGLGSQLLRSHLARLDRTGRAAFLETATPRNVAFYQRHGFRITGEYQPPPDGPTVWAMWRDGVVV